MRKDNQHRPTIVIAREARRLDHLVKPPRGLSDPQRQQLEKWLGKESEK